MDLNGDCLLKIFRHMDVEDVAIASDVCQRFQDLAKEAFKYEWKGKLVWLSNETRESALESSAILHNFGSQLQKVQIVFGERRNDAFFNRIVEKCCSSQLTEVDVCGEILSKENVCRLKNKFTNLRSLGFEKTTHNFADLECIVQHFPTSEQIRLFGHPFENRHVQQIMHLNPQLKSLSLLYRNDAENVRQMIESIDQYLPQLEELALEWMTGDDADFIGYKPMFLKNLKSLKFMNFGRGMNMQHLSISNEKVEELQLEEGTCDESVVDFICQYKEVKKLAIRYVDYPLDYKHLLKLSNDLPKLAEFEISSSCRNVHHEDIVHFISGSQQLVKFVIKDDKRKDIWEDMKDLQRQLNSSKWSVDCCLSNNELIVRKSSNSSKFGSSR